MDRPKRNIINSFVVAAPPGVVLTTVWLKKQGVSPKLAWWYVYSKWLERIGDKAYKRVGDKVTWSGAIVALQNQLDLPIHVGGKTALELLGKAHFIPMQGIKQVVLFTDPGTRIPLWLHRDELWNVIFNVYKAALFKSPEGTLAIIERPVNGLNVKLSSPERAAMEMLYLVPNYQSFEEALLIFENLAQLRPIVIQSLLEKCSSIKVKRLFLYLAQRCQHSWVSDLDTSKINLGQGKRVIGGGGDYDSKYQLSVPKVKEA